MDSKKKYFPYLLVFLALVSCKTNQLYLNVWEPAPVTIPSYVKSVGVINRSVPTDETKVFDEIDKVFTLVGAIPGIEHQADMETTVKTGWRIYDPAGKNILDEYVESESISSSGRGINPLVAARALSGRKTAVSEVSNRAGGIMHSESFLIR